jgi:CheY-like chemotaxis protein
LSRKARGGAPIPLFKIATGAGADWRGNCCSSALENARVRRSYADPQRAKNMASAPKTILFVEDNPLVLMIYSRWLQREGFAVEAAEDGEVAVEKLARLKPDLVVLDLMLPKMSGVEVLGFIRRHAGLKDTPVVVFSNAYADLNESALKTVNAGANCRLLKTEYPPARLLTTVREMLGLSRSEVETDDALRRETREGLLQEAPAEIAKIREHCLAYVKAAGTPAGIEQLNLFYQRVRFLCARSGLSHCTRVMHLASALEGMLFGIIFKNLSPSPSALQTIAQSVDCLDRLFRGGHLRADGDALAARVLVVEDDPVCGFATAAALRRAKLHADIAKDAGQALTLAEEKSYDLVLLDVEIPGLDGFELCKQLRALPAYKKTPVIFVTSHNEFQDRAQAVLSGGTDFIAKPIAPLELALKAIMHLMEPRERTRGSQPEAASAQPPAAAEKMEAVNQERSAESKPLAGKVNGISAANGAAPAPPLSPPLAAANNAGLAPSSASSSGTAGAEGSFNAPPSVGDGLNPSPAQSPETLTEENGASASAASGRWRGTRPAASALTFSIPKLCVTPSPAPRRSHTPINDTSQPLMKPSNEPLNELALAVARIIFDDDGVSDMNVRLTRIALERYNAPDILRGANAEALNLLTCGVSRIIFGDENVSEMHLRLTRIALERYGVHEILGSSPETNRRNGAVETAPAAAAHF